MNAEPPAYDEVADAYHEAVDPDGSGLHDMILEELLGEITGQQLLAVGCGQGRDARLLADLGASVIGVDVSEPLLTYARRFEQTDPRGIHYVLGNAQDLEAFDNESFDGAVCHMALMDIPDLKSAVASVARVMRPGAWFVCSIVHPCYRPHVDVLSGYFNEGHYRKVGGWDALPGHAYHRPLSTYVNSLSGVGLSITQLIEAPDEPIAEAGVPRTLYLRCLKIEPV